MSQFLNASRLTRSSIVRSYKRVANVLTRIAADFDAQRCAVASQLGRVGERRGGLCPGVSAT
jgi:hypothetical protein